MKPQTMFFFKSYTEAPGSLLGTWHHAGDTEIKVPVPALTAQWGKETVEQSTLQEVR